MSKQTEALKLALEALESGKNHGVAIDVLRRALADSALDRMAENARNLGLDYAPIVERVENSVGMGHGAWDMVEPKELAKGFHEAFAEPPCKTGSQCTSKCQQCEQPEAELKATERQVEILSDELSKCSKELAALKTQQQEPVAWTSRDYLTGDVKVLWGRQPPLGPLYTSPPASKPWVGLTYGEVLEQKKDDPIQFYRAIEAKLKEKNA